jgi:hypothetical protein
MYMQDSAHSTASANEIRLYLCQRYFEPARKRSETLVTLRAGDIHREMGLKNRVPSVCQVMESKVLERQAGVKVSSKQGPPSGRGTTLTVTYAVSSDPGTASTEIRPRQDDSITKGWDLFFALRGIGKDWYKDVGGGEAWLKNERENFYSEEKSKWL